MSLKPFCANPECPLHDKWVEDWCKHVEIVNRKFGIKDILKAPVSNEAAKFTVYLFTRVEMHVSFGMTHFWVCHECAEVPDFINKAYEAVSNV